MYPSGLIWRDKSRVGCGGIVYVREHRQPPQIVIGMTNRATRAGVRAGYPIGLSGGVVLWWCSGGCLGIGDGGKNRYIVGQAYARATPPPRHMLAKPRQILPC